MKVLIVSSDRTLGHGAPANLGDAFLTDALAGALEARGHLPSIADFGDGDRVDGLQRQRLDGIKGLAAAIWRSDAVIVGGGTLLQDDRRDRLIGGLPRLLGVVGAIARVRRVPIGFYGVGCDPVTRRVPRILLRSATAKSPVWLRDEPSLNRAQIMLGRKLHLGADASLLLTAPAGHSRSVDAVIALNRSDGDQLQQSVVRLIAASGFSPKFISMEQQADSGDFRAVPPAALRSMNFDAAPIGWQSAFDTIAASSLVVASRMHALYMAALSGTPAVAVGDKPKVRSFAAEFGLHRVDSLSDLVSLKSLTRAAEPAAVHRAKQRADASLDALLETLASAVLTKKR